MKKKILSKTLLIIFLLSNVILIIGYCITWSKNTSTLEIYEWGVGIPGSGSPWQYSNFADNYLYFLVIPILTGIGSLCLLHKKAKFALVNSILSFTLFVTAIEHFFPESINYTEPTDQPNSIHSLRSLAAIGYPGRSIENYEKKIIIIILLVQPFLTFAGGTVWKTETIKQAIKDQENIFKAKVIDFKVTTPDGKNYTAKEYKAHMEINRYINQKIYSLTDFDWEEEEDPFGEPKVIDKRIQKIIKETESKRKSSLSITSQS